MALLRLLWRPKRGVRTRKPKEKDGEEDTEGAGNDAPYLLEILGVLDNRFGIGDLNIYRQAFLKLVRSDAEVAHQAAGL